MSEPTRSRADQRLIDALFADIDEYRAENERLEVLYQGMRNDLFAANNTIIDLKQELRKRGPQ